MSTQLCREMVPGGQHPPLYQRHSPARARADATLHGAPLPGTAPATATHLRATTGWSQRAAAFVAHTIVYHPTWTAHGSRGGSGRVARMTENGSRNRVRFANAGRRLTSSSATGEQWADCVTDAVLARLLRGRAPIVISGVGARERTRATTNDRSGRRSRTRPRTRRPPRARIRGDRALTLDPTTGVDGSDVWVNTSQDPTTWSR